MKKLILILLIFSGGLGLWAYLVEKKQEQQLNQVEVLLHQGLLGKDSEEQSVIINQALEMLLKMKQPSPKHSLLLGDALFHLGEYPLSLYYYKEALHQNPSAPAVQERVDRVIKMLNIKGNIPPSLWQKWALGTHFSRVFLEKIFIPFFLLTLLTGSYWISCAQSRIRRFIFVSTLLPTTYLLLCIVSLYYFSPIEGVLIHPSILYQGSSSTAAPVANQSLAAGSSLIVLDAEKGGEWLKVRTVDGVLGYLPQDAIRVLP